MLHTLNSDKDFVHVTLVPWSRPPASQATGKTRGKFLAPASHRLVGDDHAALSQDQLNIPQAEAEYVIQSDSVADDIGGKSMPIMRVGRQLHAVSLVCFQGYGQRRLR